MRIIPLFVCFWILLAGATNHPKNGLIVGSNSSTEADSLMEWLVGKWTGEGFSYNNLIADELEWHWTMDKKFLAMSIRSTLGDSFKAEGYLFYDKNSKELKFYEFANVSGVRWFSGEVKSNMLLFNEMPPDKNCELSFKFNNRNSFSIEESSYTKDDKITKVKEAFKRRL